VAQGTRAFHSACCSQMLLMSAGLPQPICMPGLSCGWMDSPAGEAPTTLHQGSPGWGDKSYIILTASGVGIDQG